MIRPSQNSSRPIRIVLAVNPTALRLRYAEAINQEPDMKLVRLTNDPVELLLAVRQTEADVVLISLPQRDELPPICTQLFDEFGELLVLGVKEDGRHARLWRQQVVETPVHSESSAGLLSAVRHRVAGSIFAADERELQT